MPTLVFFSVKYIFTHMLDIILYTFSKYIYTRTYQDFSITRERLLYNVQVHVQCTLYKYIERKQKPSCCNLVKKNIYF